MGPLLSSQMSHTAIKNEHPGDGNGVGTDNDNVASDWPVQEIIGEQIIEGQKYFWVMWEPSLVSEVDARGAKRLIEDWESRKARNQKRSMRRIERSNSGKSSKKLYEVT